MAKVGQSGSPTWYLTDNIGSVRQVVSSNGTVLDAINYDSFGQVLSESNAANGDRFKFTGREWDAELGQYYYRARSFSASTGRFLSEDSLGLLAGDSNYYRYATNTPLAATDPTGHDVYYLYDPNDIPGGHAGLLIGPYNGHWYYVSFGPVGSNWVYSGLLTQITFETFAQANSDARLQRFKYAVQFKANKERMADAFNFFVNKYDKEIWGPGVFYRDSCTEACTEALFESNILSKKGLNRLQYNHEIPHIAYQQLKKEKEAVSSFKLNHDESLNIFLLQYEYGVISSIQPPKENHNAVISLSGK